MPLYNNLLKDEKIFYHLVIPVNKLELTCNKCIQTNLFNLGRFRYRTFNDSPSYMEGFLAKYKKKQTVFAYKHCILSKYMILNEIALLKFRVWTVQTYSSE